MDITKLTALKMKEKLNNQEISSREIIEAHFKRIEEVEDDINAFITLTKEEALERADYVDNKRKNGEKLGPLAGIPIGIKDNIITKDIRTTCGSKMLENFIPPYDATIIEKIKEADGIILGKTNLDEFAAGSTTETSYFGPTKNPIDLEKIPGGSSGGSSAVVRSHEVALSLGTDTGGSIRQPASYCGVVGIKPSYGAVSRYGLVSLANTLDQIGVFGRNVLDAALMLGVITGHDDKDSTSMDMESIDYIEKLTEDIKNMKIAIPREYFDLEMDNRIKDEILKSIKLFETLGANIEEISLPHTKYAWATYYLISTAEISANLARFDGIRYGYRAKEYETLDELYINTRSEAFGKEIKKRIMAGTYNISSAHNEEYYKKALKLRTLIKDDFDKAFEKYDVILSPTVPDLPSKIGDSIEKSHSSNIFTTPVNLAGICAISIPCGYVDKLPVGLQIIGDRFKESNILKAAYAFEKHSSLGGDK